MNIKYKTLQKPWERVHNIVICRPRVGAAPQRTGEDTGFSETGFGQKSAYIILI